MMDLSHERLPLLNQRFEYDHYRRVLKDPKFRTQFESGTDELANFSCGKFVWAGGVQEGATVLIQRIVLGMEARIPIAVSMELSCRGELTEELLDKLQNPYDLKQDRRDGTLQCYYNRAPALIDPSIGLQIAKPNLWPKMQWFYSKIRNPIFHGSYLTNVDAPKLDEVFAMFDEVYSWCDSWCDVFQRLNEIGKRNSRTP